MLNSLKQTIRIKIKETETIHRLPPPLPVLPPPSFMTLLPLLYKMNQSLKNLFLILSVCLNLEFSNDFQLIIDINR